jgi:hypothetical protein
VLGAASPVADLAGAAWLDHGVPLCFEQLAPEFLVLRRALLDLPSPSGSMRALKRSILKR